MRKFLVLSICSLATAFVPVAAQAIYITNVTTGVTLFNDDFELAPGVSHTATPDLTGDYNPVPSVGSYLIQEGDPSIGQVTDFSDGTNAGPGAAQGNNYFRIFHDGAGHEYQAELASTPADGDLIHIEFKAFFTANTGGNQSVFKIRGDGLGGDAQRAGGRAGEGGVVFDLNGDPTSLTYAVGQWQKWEFDYTIGQSTYTMKVDGVSSGPISNLTRGGPGNIEGFGFWSGSVGASYYLDGRPVPEPETLLLLVTGLAGAACYAWRQQNR